ncbi:hypothetical protein Daus18300_006765 [Diaporthe australafricana]|uniref:Ankyrin repeat protein n=1 Tax=Diaporthe australafricana TaxID=127596 RepID=A0ABR3WSA0_9PEZI
MAHEEEHDGASAKEILVEACRRNNVELMQETLEGKSEKEAADLLNNTKSVMGNHLYHEAAARGNYEIIDFLLDQDNFECDPTNRVEGDTPLHTAVRWINSEPEAQREFGNALVEMMLEAGSSPRVKNKGGLTAYQLVDPRNAGLRDLIQKHEYAALNKGDFIQQGSGGAAAADGVISAPMLDVDSDDDAEFSGSDDDERAEWERRRKQKAAKKG